MISFPRPYLLLLPTPVAKKFTVKSVIGIYGQPEVSLLQGKQQVIPLLAGTPRGRLGLQAGTVGGFHTCTSQLAPSSDFLLDVQANLPILN